MDRRDENVHTYLPRHSRHTRAIIRVSIKSRRVKLRKFILSLAMISALVFAESAHGQSPSGGGTYLQNAQRQNSSADGLSFTGRTLELKESWSFKAGGPINAAPLVTDRVAYVPSYDGYVYAIDLSSHQVLWKQFLGTQTSWLGPSGVASPPELAADLGPHGAILVGGGGHLTPSESHLYYFALDAQTGDVLWKTAIGSAAYDSVFDAALYLHGRVYIGIAGSGYNWNTAAPPRRGIFYELEGKTGKILHKLVLSAPRFAGAAVWGSAAASPDGKTVFIPTGDGTIRAQHLTEAIVAVRASDLKVLDHWQAPEALQAGDDDFGASVVLYRDGKRTLVGSVIKTGRFYAFQTGRLKKGPVWSRQLGGTASFSS